MAKYRVDDFSHTVKDNGKGFKNLYIHCKLINSSGNPVVRNYRVAPDDRFPNLDQLEKMFALGFGQAKSSGARVELTEFKERMYLFFTLPGVNNGSQIQVTGDRQK